MEKTQFEQLISKSSPYLKEARKRLAFFIIFFFLFFCAGFIFFRQMVTFFFRLFQLGESKIVFTSPFQVFDLAVNSGLFTAIVFSSPVLLYELVSFIKPALKKEEKKLIRPILYSGFGLFLFGFIFGLILMRFVVYGFSQTFSGGQFGHLYDIEVFLSQILLTSAFLGLIFEFPLIIYFLVRLNLVDIKFFEKKRRWIIAGAFIFLSLLPPADGFSLVLMVLPVLLLFEASLLLLKRREVRLNVR